jgi:hypothetical protein
MSFFLLLAVIEADMLAYIDISRAEEYEDESSPKCECSTLEFNIPADSLPITR